MLAMTPTQLETWVHQVLEQLSSGAPGEDARVELKREWPDPVQTARRLAGHANSVGDDLILWMVGVDEKGKSVPGVAALEVSSWLAKTHACFEGDPPTLLMNLNVRVADRTIVALLFDGGRRPFIVRNPQFGAPNGGPVELEVPWREGNRVRSARRHGLFRMLTPLVRAPRLTVVGAKVNTKLANRKSDGSECVQWRCWANVYITPVAAGIITLPWHTFTASIATARTGELSLHSLQARGNDTTTVEGSVVTTRSEIIVKSPGMIHFYGDCLTDPPQPLPSGDLALKVEFEVAGDSARHRAVATLAAKSDASGWAVGRV